MTSVQRERLKVWYDEISMKPGDIHVESIEKGIKGSNYGILIVSKDFLKSKWTKHEFMMPDRREPKSSDF
jgi:hypothetical protein